MALQAESQGCWPRFPDWVFYDRFRNIWPVLKCPGHEKNYLAIFYKNLNFLLFCMFWDDWTACHCYSNTMDGASTLYYFEVCSNDLFQTLHLQSADLTSSDSQGRTQEFFKGGCWNFDKNILLSLKYRLPYILQHLCHMCYFNFNTSTLFLTRSSRDVCFPSPVFPCYHDFANLLKYDAMQFGTSLQNFDIVYGSL